VAAERRRQAAAQATEPAAAEPEAGAAPGFPVPPLDLPHYHGVGVTASPGPGLVDPGDVPRAGVKEVTGA
jgi:hypothetical protein